MQLLLDAGASTDMADKDGRVPIDMSSSAEIRALLSEAHAGPSPPNLVWCYETRGRPVGVADFNEPSAYRQASPRRFSTSASGKLVLRSSNLSSEDRVSGPQ